MARGNVSWVLVDVGQSENVDIDDNYITLIFHINETTPLPLNIPVYSLKKILTNTLEILGRRNKSLAAEEKNLEEQLAQGNHLKRRKFSRSQLLHRKSETNIVARHASFMSSI